MNDATASDHTHPFLCFVGASQLCIPLLFPRLPFSAFLLAAPIKVQYGMAKVVSACKKRYLAFSTSSIQIKFFDAYILTKEVRAGCH
jgi:hypothetical protein